MNKLQIAFSKVINKLLLPVRLGYVFEDGRWQFRRIRMKPKKLRHTYEDGTPNWNLDGAAPLPLDENARRLLIEIPSVPVAHSRKKSSRGKPRRYLRPGLGVKEFFEELNRLGVRYAVLRWFDDLPSIAPGEDIDLLFGDEAMEKVEHLFTSNKSRGAIKCDIYSSGGLPDSSFEGLPYYEQRLADEILANTVMVKGVFRAPDTRRHLLSLAYHAVYHKAHGSGLPLNPGEPPLKVVTDHDYAAVIENLADEEGIRIDTSLRGLHRFLGEQGWMPAVDTIRKLSKNRPLLALFLSESKDALSVRGDWQPQSQLCVFVVREWAFQRNLVPWICANLRHYGFDIKWVHELNADERELAHTRIRGGNWNHGPFPVSGGPPAALIVACDYAPEPPDPEMKRKQPFARNARFVTMKQLLRNGVNRHLPDALRVNPVHSADDDHEAWDYLRSVCPQKVENIRQRLAEGYTGDPNLRLRLNRGKRATTYLVYRQGRPCVLKVFADHPDGRRAYRAEKRASEVFGEMPWAGGWLEFGPTWMLQEYHDPSGRLDLVAHQLDAETRREIAGKAISIARKIHAAGFAHRDLHAENFFLVNGELHLIDFETLAEQDASIPFEESYDVTGKGLDSPGASGNMCYINRKNDRSLCRVLGVPLAEALEAEISLLRADKG